jgi:NAD-dependent dihydropyrimidine dehydrogenase PreA subunit
MVDGHAFIDQDECLECGVCMDECPEGAIIEA